MKNYIVIFSLVGSSFLLSSCDQTSGMLGGGALGTAAGAAMGYAIDGGAGGAILGGVVGGLAGSAIGSHAGLEEEQAQCAVQQPVCVAQPAPAPVCSTVVYRDVCYEDRLEQERRMALEQARLDRERRCLEQQRNRMLEAENARLRRERDNAMMSGGCCTEYHYTTICR